MDASVRRRSLRMVLLLAAAYVLIGIAFGEFSDWATTGAMRLAGRLLAWLVAGVGFAAHIAYGHFRLANRPRTTAVHASIAAALGAGAWPWQLTCMRRWPPQITGPRWPSRSSHGRSSSQFRHLLSRWVPRQRSTAGGVARRNSVADPNSRPDVNREATHAAMGASAPRCVEPVFQSCVLPCRQGASDPGLPPPAPAGRPTRPYAVREDLPRNKGKCELRHHASN